MHLIYIVYEMPDHE